MVLTVITINSNYTILFLIRSQINNIIIKQTLTVKGPRKIIINCSSWVVPLHTFSPLVTYFNSGHCTKLAVFQFVYSGPCIDPWYWHTELISLLRIGQWAGFFSAPSKQFKFKFCMKKTVMYYWVQTKSFRSFAPLWRKCTQKMRKISRRRSGNQTAL